MSTASPTRKPGSPARKKDATVTTLTSVGANGLVQRPGERTAPAGVTHLVDGWQPLCGAGRVRFVFPGRSVDAVTEVCDDCRAVATPKVPRQRRAASA
jgi:hypothetical protein